MERKANLIGLCGPAGAGKTEISKILHRITGDCERVPFAQGVYDTAYFMGWDGVKDEKGRRLLQLVGTECGRQCIGEDVWVNKFVENFYDLADKSLLICADDIRFPNEAQAIKLLGGKVVNVQGRQHNLGTNSKHISERGIPKEMWDGIIQNGDSLAALESYLHDLLRGFGWIS
jgi:hypothetical protein